MAGTQGGTPASVREHTWAQNQILTRPLVTGAVSGVAFGLVSALYFVFAEGAPITAALLVSVVGCTAFMVPFAYVARSDMQRRDAQEPLAMPPEVGHEGWFYGRRRWLPGFVAFGLLDVYLVVTADSTFRFLWSLVLLSAVIWWGWRCWVDPLPPGFEEARARAKLEGPAFGQKVWHKALLAALLVILVVVVTAWVVERLA